MKSRDARRHALLERLADHVLAVGLQGASLRPLAAAVGTSDRMLLYYFADKNDLLTQTLALIAERLLKLLEGSLSGIQPYRILLPRICDLMSSPAMQPSMRLWLELVALASRNEEPFRAIAGQLSDGFLHWISARLKVAKEADRAATAALLFATVEGMMLLNAIGREWMVAAARKE